MKIFFDAHYVLKYMGVESQKSESLPGMASLNEYLFAFLALKVKSLNLSRNSSCLIGWKNNNKDWFLIGAV